jgi:pyruvate/2-oxoglutarate dehydrogenase complex dihydrolipoamide dehydrogenase (E3) component
VGEVAGDLLFVATGRSPAVEGLNLDAAGIEHSPGGIRVNRYLQTSARHIFAAGDVIGGPQYSHLAGWQAFQATRNALLPGRSFGVPKAMPRVTFTSPEVAQVGLTEREARARYGDALRIDSLDLGKVDRAVSEGDRRGFLKIIAHPCGRVKGAAIVGERASEAITELVMAIQRGIKLQDIAGIVHPYPTYSIGVQFLVTKMAMDATFHGPKGKLLRIVSRLYR